jgi:hypothetical protein
MGWRTNDSRAGAHLWDSEVPVGQELLARDEELAWLMRDQTKSWKLINGRISHSGDPTMMAEGLYTGLTALPPAIAAPSVANTTTATPGWALWTTTLYTPIPANAIMAPSFFKVMAGGTLALSTTSMTATFLPFIGNVVAAAAPSTFKTLGPSGVATLATTAITTGWLFQGFLVVQQTGTAGTAMFYGTMHYTTSTLPATNAATQDIFMGGTQATALDFTGTTAGYPGGMGLASWGITGTETWVPQIIALASYN